jgi:hypothetical protein
MRRDHGQGRAADDARGRRRAAVPDHVGLTRGETEAAHREGTQRIAADAERLEEIRVELDVLWDYLRQRRALRDAGRNPDDAQPRDARTVERYLG